MSPAADQFDRACGALLGVALGDALGMPSQTLTHDDVRARYGQITGFVAPFEDHPVSHGLVAGQVTDDTEQTMLLGRRLITGKGEIDPGLWASDLLNWERDVRARGLRDLLGPSSKAALDGLMSGMSPADTGRAGTTNGAAMRIAPVAIATPPAPVSAQVDRVEAACRLTHNTGEAIAAAAAVAAVISAGLNGAGFEATRPLALQSAKEGQGRGHAAGHPDMAGRIALALEIAARTRDAEAIRREIGTSVASCQSVPAAFGVVLLAEGDPWNAGLIAANIGDDTDTIGAMACAMAGACRGRGCFPEAAVRTLNAANTLDIDAMAAALLNLRAGASEPEHKIQERAT
ncbi:MAG: ADP-ribosylglycohydrolase family protein [Pseudomonadota bacterium]